MSKKKAFSKEAFQEFVKTIASDEKSLRRVFDIASSPNSATALRPNQFVRVPIKVYESCWDMHELSLRLVEAIERVSENYEHSLLLNEGYDMGYNMPSMPQMLAEMRDFKDALSEFKPYALRRKEKDYVQIPAEQVVFLSGMINYDAFMISRVFDAAMNTDYMKPFTNYRAAGYKYQGPSALQETLDLLVGLAKLSREIDRHIKSGVQRPDWESQLLYVNAGGQSPQGYNPSNDMA